MLKRYIGDRTFYRHTMAVAVPIIIQNAITNFVSLLDNIMVGQVGSAQMSGVSIVNNLLFIFNMTFRGFAKITGGMVSMGMADDICFIANGHFFRGGGRLVKHMLKRPKLTNIK